jgi:hypothetical protein
MEQYNTDEPLSCETVVSFIEGKVSVKDIPEEIISDISVSIKVSEEGFAQASRYVKIDEPFHFIVTPGSYVLECSLDQVKMRTKTFQVRPSERKTVRFLFRNEG